VRARHSFLKRTLMLNLEKYIKKYVWDDERTPYLVPVARMTRRQADYELHAYSVFVGVLCAALIFAFTKTVHAAWYCAAAPIAALLYFFVHGFHPSLSAIDHAALIVFGVIWLRYSLRVVAIARAYPGLPETGGEE
jgi:hypothetical protein